MKLHYLFQGGCSAVAMACLLAFAGAGCATQKTGSATTAMKARSQTVHEFRFASDQKDNLRYLLYLPEGYNSSSRKRWPTILFLHGAGERGTNVWKVATHGPPRLATNDFDLPFIVISPQCKQGRTWSNEMLLALLDEATKKFKVDEDRVYLTGLSMGGYGTWNLGLSYPERFAAIAPICGGGDILGPLLSSRDKAAHLKSLGIWAFHGGKDPVVPLAESERMIEVAKRAGVTDVKLTVYPEAGHDSWTETYKNPELYKWFLEHSR